MKTWSQLLWICAYESWYLVCTGLFETNNVWVSVCECVSVLLTSVQAFCDCCWFDQVTFAKIACDEVIKLSDQVFPFRHHDQPSTEFHRCACGPRRIWGELWVVILIFILCQFTCATMHILTEDCLYPWIVCKHTENGLDRSLSGKTQYYFNNFSPRREMS